MICYYRNGISCGANRMEFEDQIVIRGKKLKSNRDKTTWSNDLGKNQNFENECYGFYVKRGEEKKKRKKKKEK